MADKVTADVLTGVGTLSFPHLFKETASTNDKGETVYDLQFILPKSDREACRALVAAVKKVGLAKWGEAYKNVKIPLRDGDKEAGLPTDDGSTRGEKYPERNGCIFFNARSKKPVTVVDRQRVPIVESSEVYAGNKVKVHITFYPYSSNGNTGIGVGLNGVQKIAEGEAIGGGGKPSVESMFDMLEDEDDLDLDEAVAEEPTPPPAKKAPAKKTAAKKAAAAPKAADPEPDEDDDLADLTGDDGDSDLDSFMDLDDADDSES